MLESLHTKRLLELRIAPILSTPELVDAVVALLETNCGIRDVELCLLKNKDVMRVFKSLKHNFLVKTVRLSCGTFATKQILKFAREFERQRVCVEISLNCDHPKFGSLDKKSYITYYPE